MAIEAKKILMEQTYFHPKIEKLIKPHQRRQRCESGFESEAGSRQS
jgi:hypothetical protein